MNFFLRSQGSFNPKIRFLGQKVCPVGRSRTDTKDEYRGHPFRVSGIFPSTYHQGSVQYFLLSFPLTGGNIKRNVSGLCQSTSHYPVNCRLARIGRRSEIVQEESWRNYTKQVHVQSHTHTPLHVTHTHTHTHTQPHTLHIHTQTACISVFVCLFICLSVCRVSIHWYVCLIQRAYKLFISIVWYLMSQKKQVRPILTD